MRGFSSTEMTMIHKIIEVSSNEDKRELMRLIKELLILDRNITKRIIMSAI